MKRRTIGILTLCAVLALLVLNWQTQPFHRLQDRNVVPLSVGIVRSDARGSKVTVDGKGFIHANSSRYHLVGDSWRDAVEAVFQMGEALEMEGRL